MRKYRKVRVLKYRKVLKQFCANFKWAKSGISGPEIVPPVLGQFPVQNTGNPYYLASLQQRCSYTGWEYSPLASNYDT